MMEETTWTTPEQSPTADEQATRMAALTRLALQSALRAEAAEAGVPAARIPLVVRLAQTEGIDPAAEDAPKRIREAMEAVLDELPELRHGAAGTGAPTMSRRERADAQAEASIMRHILGR